MVNISYGIVDSGSTAQDAVINMAGTDMIVEQSDGSLASFDAGDIAWILVCCALIWLMIPGLGYLYSGLVRRKNALSLLQMTLVSLAITSIQWWLFGYSFVFSQTGGSFFGNFQNACFRGVLGQAIPESNNKLPDIVFASYQLMFATLVPAIVLGAAAERSRVFPSMIFVFFWTTFVYDVLAHAVWSSHGWASKWGVLDYAGGVPVEMASGTAGLAYSYFIGKRNGYGTDKLLFKPHNVGHVVIGTVLLWVGWLGFNGGSTFAANLKAALSLFNTNLAGSVGGLVWMCMDYRLDKKWSVVGYCTGAIAGLVAITPAAGFVGTPAAALIGLVAGGLCNLATGLKVTMRVDDPMDVFAVHCLAGAIGLLMTGIFTQASVAANDGYLVIDGGWLDKNWIQVPKQLAWIAFGFFYTFVATYLIMFVIDKIPGCHFRASEEAEIIGMDEVEHGEYVFTEFDAVDAPEEGVQTVDMDEKQASDKWSGGSQEKAVGGVDDGVTPRGGAGAGAGVGERDSTVIGDISPDRYRRDASRSRVRGDNDWEARGIREQVEGGGRSTDEHSRGRRGSMRIQRSRRDEHSL